MRQRFLAHWFKAKEKLFLRLTSEATHGTKKLDMWAIESTLIGVPSYAEQEMIEVRLDTMDRLVAESSDQLVKLRSLKTGLMQDLLTGKVSVEPLLSSVISDIGP